MECMSFWDGAESFFLGVKQKVSKSLLKRDIFDNSTTWVYRRPVMLVKQFVLLVWGTIDQSSRTIDDCSVGLPLGYLQDHDQQKHHIDLWMVVVYWVVVSNIFYFHPYLGKIPILTSILFRWVVQPPTSLVFIETSMKRISMPRRCPTYAEPSHPLNLDGSFFLGNIIKITHKSDIMGRIDIYIYI